MLFEELISKTENEIMRMSPLTWAYVGDSIYEVYVRTYLSNSTNLNPHKMHHIPLLQPESFRDSRLLP